MRSFFAAVFHNDSRKALGGILGALFFYALMPATAVLVSRRGLLPMENFFLCSCGSTLVIGLTTWFSNGNRKWTLLWRSLPVAFLLGLFGYSLFYFLFLTVLADTAAAGIPLVIMVNYTWPLFVLVFLAWWVQKRRVRLFEWIGLLVAAAGVYFSSSESGGGDWNFRMVYSLLLTLLAAMVWGAFTAASKLLRADSMECVFVYNLTALLTSGIWLLWRGVSPAFFDSGNIAWSLFSGVVCYGGATSLYFLAMKRHPSAGQLALFNLTPFVALGFMALLHGIPFQVSTLLGIGIVVSGILVATWGDKLFTLRQKL